ncbi:hypothetical protein HWV62_20886 [Athelia sp. TMB]|nr:hypothetical protein HWV62_20886 [Athelia sp. TMB]
MAVAPVTQSPVPFCPPIPSLSSNASPSNTSTTSKPAPVRLTIFPLKTSKMSRSRTAAANETQIYNAYSLSLLSEYTHTLDSLPLDLSRNFADLRELDAVLSSQMASITLKIRNLTQMIEDGAASKEDRLLLLQDIASEASNLKMGGDDKIRVACQAADNLKLHMGHMKSLLRNLPSFDMSVLNRQTVYPHVASRSYQPPATTEAGRRRRGVGSLLSVAPDPSPVKRRRVQEDYEIVASKTPKKDKVAEVAAQNRNRNNGTRKKPERANSPSESVLSVTSHLPQQTHAIPSGVHWIDGPSGRSMVLRDM